MGERIEIPLPDSERSYTAWREGDEIHFEPCPVLGWQRWLGLIVVISVGTVPLIFYLLIATAFQWRGDGLPWATHLLFLGFDGLLLYVVSHQALAVTRFQSCTLRRMDEEAIGMEIHRRNRQVRHHRILEPVCFTILLHRDSESASISNTITNENGVTRLEKYRDLVEVDLELRGSRVIPRMHLMSKKWTRPLPRYMSVYHKDRNVEANCAATVDAARPLADAIRECLGIPVEFRLVGGAFHVRLEVEG